MTKIIAITALLVTTYNSLCEVAITSFAANGTVTWTNAQVPAICHFEWAPSLTSQWSRGWTDFTDIPMTNTTQALPVPMFFRVVCETSDFQNGLALYLPLDGHTRDLSTNHTDGVAAGAAPGMDRDGNLTNAYTFAGNGTEIYVPDTASLDVNLLTLSFWFKTTTLSGYSEPVNKFGGQGNISYGTEIRPDGKIYFRVCPGGTTGTLTDLASGTVLTAGIWHHFAGTYDGTQMKIYINGSLDAAAPKTGNIFNSAEPLRIGRYGYYSYYFNGTIDEVAVWNRALSATEVKELHLRSGKP